jgi:hypothetical protein
MTPTQRLREALHAFAEIDLATPGVPRDFAERVLRARAALAEAPEAGEPVAETGAVLPDGSAFMVASFPLPADHWLYAPRTEWDSVRDDFAETPIPILSNHQRQAVAAAARYAIRGATMCGKEMDFDPDAMVLNFCYAMCGDARAATAATSTPAPAPLVALTEGEVLAAMDRALGKECPTGVRAVEGFAADLSAEIQRALAAKNGLTLAEEGQKP